MRAWKASRPRSLAVIGFTSNRRYAHFHLFCCGRNRIPEGKAVTDAGLTSSSGWVSADGRKDLVGSQGPWVLNNSTPAGLADQHRHQDAAKGQEILHREARHVARDASNQGRRPLLHDL